MEHLAAANAIHPNALSLYIHIPFCDHKCSYCDFNSYAGLERMMPAFTDALVHELCAWAPALGGRMLQTIFFGGGTPSLLPLADLRRVLRTVRERFTVTSGAEVTLEANPGTVDAAYLSGLRDAGVNRLSIGVQSLQDAELRLLDRIHDAVSAVAAYRSARAAGFDNINLDLIFGLAGQSLQGWEHTLSGALALAPEHLSLYALTIEDGTGLAAQIARGVAPEPDADLQAAMYERTQDLMSDAGYRHYEISNWCRPGAECCHNLVYWRDGDWLGVGPGAHSHLDGRRFAVVRSPSAYIERARHAGRPGESLRERMPQIDTEEAPDAATARADAAMLALRLAEGLDVATFADRFGITPDDAFGDALRESDSLGLVRRDARTIALTRRGRLFSNEVFVRLLQATQ